MYEDQIQNYDQEIHEEYLIHMIHPFSCHIIYSHVQILAQLITLKHNKFLL